ncbi:hypothetical protein [Nocardia mangyaensis]|uniref:hypothetical protein n=1 Tax=Nocardia mangyaensis TaxID=2213200 RepID=UPI0026747B3D|nr:hypothetical protein [Nocardia mangyaensis]MDO3648737.1 hypothetical protein [Nocardia mangyaensis]
MTFEAVGEKSVRRGRWWVWAAWMLGVCLLISLGVYGCGRAVDHAIDQTMVADVEESTSSELLEEATEYGGWVLPVNSEVLLVQREIIRDRKYRIAVEMSPADLAAMLENSRFPIALSLRNPPYPVKTIAGPPLESSPRVERGQEAWFTSASGKVMIREVTVDVRDETTRIVHLEFRGV